MRTGRRTEFRQVPNTTRRAWPGSRPTNRAHTRPARIDFFGGDGVDIGIECPHRLHRDTVHADFLDPCDLLQLTVRDRAERFDRDRLAEISSNVCRPLLNPMLEPTSSVPS